MPDKNAKTALVAFKVESELADLLSKLPNKSEFIRNAIAAHLGTCCPLCNGKGVVSRGEHDHYVRLINADRFERGSSPTTRYTAPVRVDNTSQSPVPGIGFAEQM